MAQVISYNGSESITEFKLFSEATDTEVDSTSTVNAGANSPGHYLPSFSGLTHARYRVEGWNSTRRLSWDHVTINADDGTFQTDTGRQPVLVGLKYRHTQNAADAENKTADVTIEEQLS